LINPIKSSQFFDKNFSSICKWNFYVAFFFLILISKLILFAMLIEAPESKIPNCKIIIIDYISWIVTFIVVFYVINFYCVALSEK